MSSGFFEFREQMTAKLKGAAPAPPRGQAMTVGELTSWIDRALRSQLPLTVHVRGEVSNWNEHRASGHRYFTLKDTDACIDCVLFKSDGARLKFVPSDGMELIATGRVGVFPQRGRYQLYVTHLQPVGKGALELAFQQLKEKLQREGLFAAERKKPLPRYPMRIAVLTSRETAALQDVLKVLRRYPWIRLYLYDTPVQGDGAGERIAAAIAHLDHHAQRIGGVDLVLLARGGGSLEDLWAFNEECVARAMSRCRIPIVSGIGHEVDTCIADLIADYHAHTPTEAAQVVTTYWRSVKETIDRGGIRLGRSLATILRDAQQRLLAIERHEAFRRPADRINRLRQLLDDRQRTMEFAILGRLRDLRQRLSQSQVRLEARHPAHALRLHAQRLTSLQQRLQQETRSSLARRNLRLDMLHKQLEALNPMRVLQRGYSITRLKQGKQVVRSAAQIKPGDKLITRFADGEAESVAKDPTQPELFD